MTDGVEQYRTCWVTGKKCPSPTLVCEYCWVKINQGVNK